VANFDAIAFGCPAMGAEVLEEGEFQPMWDEVKGSLKGKKIALFGKRLIIRCATL
jgi:flavodoxin